MTDPFRPGETPAPGQPQQPAAPTPPGGLPPTAHPPAAPRQPTPQQPNQQPPTQQPVNPNETMVQPPGSMPQAPAGVGHPPGYPTAVAPPGGAAPPGFPQPAGAQPLGAAKPYAGFGGRLIATLVDGIIASIIMTLIALPLIAWSIATYDTQPSGCDLDQDFDCQVSDEFAGVVAISIGIYLLLALIFTFFYYIRPVAKSGQTIGRRVANIRVVNEDTGEAPGLGKSFVRYLVASIISGAIFYLGYLWMLWDDKSQTWHDKVAGTIVVAD